jgi:hypothetical protein
MAPGTLNGQIRQARTGHLSLPISALFRHFFLGCSPFAHRLACPEIISWVWSIRCSFVLVAGTHCLLTCIASVWLDSGCKVQDPRP